MPVHGQTHGVIWKLGLEEGFADALPVLYTQSHLVGRDRIDCKFTWKIFFFLAET